MLLVVSSVLIALGFDQRRKATGRRRPQQKLPSCREDQEALPPGRPGLARRGARPRGRRGQAQDDVGRGRRGVAALAPPTPLPEPGAGVAGLTPKDVTVLTDIDQLTISRYLAGSITPGTKNLRKLAVGLGVSADWLIGAIERPPDRLF